MRKKLENKEKFKFNEQDIPPPVPQHIAERKSVQSRLFRKKADEIPRSSQQFSSLSSSFPASTSGLGGGRPNLNQAPGYKYRQPLQAAASPQPGSNNNNSTIIVKGGAEGGRQRPMVGAARAGQSDPVLDNIVAKLRAGYESSLARSQHSAEDEDCMCSRPVKLVRGNIENRHVLSLYVRNNYSPQVMCSLCGHTTTGRVRAQCSRHPKAVFLQDLATCTACKQGAADTLKEFELPNEMKKALGDIGKN